MIGFTLGTIFLTSILDIFCLAEQFCDNRQCVDEGYIFGTIVSFAVFVTLGTLVICCPCIVYKYCCTKRDPGAIYTTRTGVAVSLTSNYPPYPQQQMQQPIVYPIYGIPPPDYTAVAIPVTLQQKAHPAGVPTVGLPTS